MIKQEFKTNDNRRWYREEYLKSDHWKQLRATVIKPDKLCTACCARHAIDAHHLDYKNIFDVHAGDLMALCRRCHNECHELLKDRTLIRKRKWGMVVKFCLMGRAILQNREGELTENQRERALKILRKSEKDKYFRDSAEKWRNKCKSKSRRRRKRKKAAIMRADFESRYVAPTA